MEETVKKSALVATSLISISFILGLVFHAFFMAPNESRADTPQKMDYVTVIATSQTGPGRGCDQGCWFLLDKKNGDIWAYNDQALLGSGDPVYLGRLVELGKPIVKAPEKDQE